MEILPVTSASNSLLKRIRLLHNASGRKKEERFLIEGAKLLDEAVRNGIEVEDVVVSQSYFEREFNKNDFENNVSKIVVVEDKLFAPLATTETPQGLVAVAKLKTCAPDDLFKHSAPLVVIADRVQDPGNLGTMLRTCLALGATGMILTKGSVDAFNPKVVRSASGALFALPFIEGVSIEDAIAECRQRGLNVLALSADGSTELGNVDLVEPCALLLGNEANGLESSTEVIADFVVSIPMTDKSESLNVAIANAVVMYEASSQRRKSL